LPSCPVLALTAWTERKAMGKCGLIPSGNELVHLAESQLWEMIKSQSCWAN
jgi:hypothetical protein